MLFFFVISDVFAAAVIRAAKRFDLRIPEDIIVVGFDNLDISIMTCPTITTVNQPSFQLGYSACELLLDSINHPDMFPKSLILDTELIIRESSAKFNARQIALPGVPVNFLITVHKSCQTLRRPRNASPTPHSIRQKCAISVSAMSSTIHFSVCRQFRDDALPDVLI